MHPTGIIMNNTRHSFSNVVASIIILYCHVFAYCSNDMYYIHMNMTCLQCQPGTHWVADCTNAGGSAVCKPCSEGSFIARYNRALSCQKCRSSCRNTNHGETDEQREEVAHSCTRTSDLLCRCRDGFWREPGINGACRTVTSCGLGSGVKTLASENSDTVCEVCIHGKTFSNSTSTKEKCLPCSMCGMHHILKQSCTRTEDTVCTARTTDDAGEHIELNQIDTNHHDDEPPLQPNGHARHEIQNETGSQSNEDAVDEPSYERDEQEVVDDANRDQNNECFASETNKPSSGNTTNNQSDDNDASKSELFMQKVSCALSKEMDASYRTFFRRNGISERMVSVIELEESRVRDRCYKLFIDWAKKQENTISLPTYEVPLELIRRLTDMFQQDEDLNCSHTCIAIMSRFEITWCQQCSQDYTFV